MELPAGQDEAASAMNTADRMEDLPEDALLDEEEESGAELQFPGRGPGDEPAGGAVEGWPNKRRRIWRSRFSPLPGRGVSQRKAEPARSYSTAAR